MGQKNRNRNNTKRSQKEAARKIARKRINRESRLVIDRMRKMAMRTKSVDLEPQNFLELSQEISLPGCDGAGECCKNKIVRINPGDIWRIMHSKKVCDLFGIELTVDLFKGPEERSLLHYMLDPRAGIPICIIRRDLQANGSEERCAFFVDKDGEYSCILGDDRPMACLANPVTRVGRKDNQQCLSGWNYTLWDNLCQNCAKNNDEKIITTVEDWLVQKGMEHHYQIADLFFGFSGWLANEVKTEEMKKLATMLVFDYDRYFLDICGLSREEVLKHRPESPEHVIVNARMVVEAVMKGSINEQKSGGDIKGDTTSNNR